MEEIADAALGDRSSDVFDVVVEDASIKNDSETLDHGEQDIKDASVPLLLADYEVIKLTPRTSFGKNSAVS